MLAERLALDPKYVFPAFEDTWYYLWRERQLPVNVDPFDSRLDDELERARLRRVFDHRLDKEVGYVLPLARESRPGLAGPAWVSGAWLFRDKRMYLIPTAEVSLTNLVADSILEAEALPLRMTSSSASSV